MCCGVLTGSIAGKSLARCNVIYGTGDSDHQGHQLGRAWYLKGLGWGEYQRFQSVNPGVAPQYSNSLAEATVQRRLTVVLLSAYAWLCVVLWSFCLFMIKLIFNSWVMYYRHETWTELKYIDSEAQSWSWLLWHWLFVESAGVIRYKVGDKSLRSPHKLGEAMSIHNPMNLYVTQTQLVELSSIVIYVIIWTLDYIDCMLFELIKSQWLIHVASESAAVS